MREKPEIRKIYARISLRGTMALAMAGAALERAVRPLEGIATGRYRRHDVPLNRLPIYSPSLHLSPEAPLSRELPDVPLDFIPGSEFRKGLPQDLKRTAAHEFGHAYVGDFKGATLDSISLHPDDDSLARTVFIGHVPTGKLQTIAAAGAVATDFGPAEGYGDDLYKVFRLSYAEDGTSPQAAYDEAKKIIYSELKDVRENAIEMIAYLGEVPGEWFPLILKRARLEAAGEISANYAGTGQVPERKKSTLLKGRFTEIGHLVGGGYRVRYIVDGRIIDEKRVCGLCLGMNGHVMDCPMLRGNGGEGQSEFAKRGVVLLTPEHTSGYIYFGEPEEN